MYSLKKLVASAFALAVLTVSPNASAGLMTFDIHWSDSDGASALATLTLDSALIQVSAYPTDIIPINQINSLVVTVTGATVGNGQFGKADFTGISFYTASAVNLQQELIGQPVTIHSGMGGQDFYYDVPYGVNDDGRSGAFNIYNATATAPQTVAPFGIITDGTQPVSDFLQVTSILARQQVSPVLADQQVSAVPEPATYAMLFTGLCLVLLYARRQTTSTARIESD